MIASAPNLRVLDDASISRGLNLATELFHRINRIVPEDQKLLVFRPETPVRDAVRLMRENSYSQVPVVDQEQVLGVFSYRSFALKAAVASHEDVIRQKLAPGDLVVEEFIEAFEFARVTDEMQQVFGAMDRDNGVLIGSPDHLQGILTPMDFLRYLYDVASPFVMISEIELALRALIRIAVTDEELRLCAEHSLSRLSVNGRTPSRLEDMTFDNYRSVICDSRNWTRFEAVLGGTRHRVSAKLKEVCQVRNDLFHFKRQITITDHETLAEHRDWLLRKIRQADLRRKERPT